MKKYIITVILIITLFVFGYFYYFSKNSDTANNNTAELISQENTYKNDKYNISFNYPEDLFLNEETNDSVSIGDQAGFWHILFYVDPAPESLESWMEENKSLWTQVEELNIDGQKAIKLDNRGTGEGSGNEYLIIMIKEDYMYRIMYRYLEDVERDNLINSISINNEF